MIKERKEFFYKAFGKNWFRDAWVQIEGLFSEGWRVCKNEEHRRNLESMFTINGVRIIFERDNISLSLEHLKSLTKIDEYKEFCKKCNIEYDKTLEKKPMKFKKFIREYLENYEGKKEDAKPNIFLNKDSFKPINKVDNLGNE